MNNIYICKEDRLNDMDFYQDINTYLVVGGSKYLENKT